MSSSLRSTPLTALASLPFSGSYQSPLSSQRHSMILATSSSDRIAWLSDGQLRVEGAMSYERGERPRSVYERRSDVALDRWRTDL